MYNEKRNIAVIIIVRLKKVNKLCKEIDLSCFLICLKLMSSVGVAIGFKPSPMLFPISLTTFQSSVVFVGVVLVGFVVVLELKKEIALIVSCGMLLSWVNCSGSDVICGSVIFLFRDSLLPESVWFMKIIFTSINTKRIIKMLLSRYIFIFKLVIILILI
jgi:hypothetical protein